MNWKKCMSLIKVTFFQSFIPYKSIFYNVLFHVNLQSSPKTLVVVDIKPFGVGFQMNWFILNTCTSTDKPLIYALLMLFYIHMYTKWAKLRTFSRCRINIFDALIAHIVMYTKFTREDVDTDQTKIRSAYLCNSCFDEVIHSTQLNWVQEHSLEREYSRKRGQVLTLFIPTNYTRHPKCAIAHWCKYNRCAYRLSIYTQISCRRHWLSF